MKNTCFKIKRSIAKLELNGDACIMYIPPWYSSIRWPSLSSSLLLAFSKLVKEIVSRANGIQIRLETH